MPLPLFHTAQGVPESLRTQVSILRERAAMIREVTEMVQAVSTKGVWDSPSGDLFASRVGETPHALRRIADRLEEASGALAPYPDQLAESQRVMRRAEEDYREYDRVATARANELSTMSPEDPGYARVDREWRDAADEREFAKRRYTREGEQATLDEEEVAAKLEDIAQHGGDPAMYDLFEGLSDLGQSDAVNSLVADFIRPVALLRIGYPVGQLGLRAFYDQGSYTGVGQATSQTLMSLVKVGKGAGAAADDAARQTGRASEVAAAKSRHATRVEPAARMPKRVSHKAGSAIKQTTAGAKVRARHSARDAFDKAVGVRLVNDMTSDWSAIAGAGHVTKGVHIATYSIAAADKAYGTVCQAQTVGEAVKKQTKGEQKSVASAGARCER